MWKACDPREAFSVGIGEHGGCEARGEGVCGEVAQRLRIRRGEVHVGCEGWGHPSCGASHEAHCILMDAVDDVRGNGEELCVVAEEGEEVCITYEEFVARW